MGAKTLAITALKLSTLSIMTLNLMTLIKMTLGAALLRINNYKIMTL